MKITKKELITKIENKINELKNIINKKTERWLKLNNDMKDAQKHGFRTMVSEHKNMLQELDLEIEKMLAQKNVLEDLFKEDFCQYNIIKIAGDK